MRKASDMPRPRTVEDQGGCVSTLVVLLLSIPLGVYRAWVFMLLWGWFVVPLGVRPVGFWLSYGLMTFVSFATVTYNSANLVADKDLPANERATWIVMHSVLASTVALAIGYAVYRLGVL